MLAPAAEATSDGLCRVTPLTSETSTEDDCSQCRRTELRSSACDCLVRSATSSGVQSPTSSILNEAIRVNHDLSDRIDWADRLRSKDDQIERLKGELRQATANLEAALEAAASPASNQVPGKKHAAAAIDLGTESPLNLFIQCFKQKYDVSVNPNDVAIFV